jgi:hypothetical protein
VPGASHEHQGCILRAINGQHGRRTTGSPLGVDGALRRKERTDAARPSHKPDAGPSQVIVPPPLRRSRPGRRSTAPTHAACPPRPFGWPRLRLGLPPPPDREALPRLRWRARCRIRPGRSSLVEVAWTPKRPGRLPTGRACFVLTRRTDGTGLRHVRIPRRLWASYRCAVGWHRGPPVSNSRRAAWPTG